MKNKAVQKNGLNFLLTKEFESSLRAYGFQRAKGRQPYYIRVTPGGEILHVIAFYEDKKAVTHDNKIAFDIMGGIATVYRRELTFSKNVRTNLNWMRSNGWIMANYKRLMPEYEFSQMILRDDYRFYCERTPEAITNEIQHALEITKQILLPLMDQIVNIEACIKYRHILGMTMHTYYAEPANNFGNDRPNDFYNEGLLYFLLDPYIFRSANPFPSGEFELKCYEAFEKIQNDHNLLERVKEELKRRKSQNIESLLSYGIDYHI